MKSKISDAFSKCAVRFGRPRVWEQNLLSTVCGVDISGCDVSRVKIPEEDYRIGCFLTTLACGPSSREIYEMTGEVANVPWDELHELRECVCFLHRSPEYYTKRSELVRVPVPCRVTGFGRPREERAGESSFWQGT